MSPLYVYRCPEGHEREITHRMFYQTGVLCDCGTPMARVPQSVSVIWGGLRPSQGELSADVQDLIDTAPERKDRFLARHEYHERDNDGKG